MMMVIFMMMMMMMMNLLLIGEVSKDIQSDSLQNHSGFWCESENIQTQSWLPSETSIKHLHAGKLII